MNVKFIFISLLSLSIFALNSCTIAPQEIKYGKDHCYHCDMTVVDKTHAAEYVTTKGKVHVFDAVECLVMKLKDEQNEADMSFLLVVDYSNPGVLISAKSATYLICEKIKSPMGANLSAFDSKESAEKVMQENGGKLFSWEELKQKFAN